MVARTDSSNGALESSAGAALYRFTRPHTIRGTMLGSVSGCVRALLEDLSLVNLALLPQAILGMLALLLGNAFIVGINQIFDVKIDKVNKPFLPLASGEMTAKVAWTVVMASAITGLAIVRMCFSRLILGLYTFGMAFGALYSVPPFRFKRYPALAAITISCVRGFLMNFGVYHATKSAIGAEFAWSPPIMFLAVFMSIFACVIALAKDLPDISGDKEGGVSTFATRVGTQRVVHVVLVLLTMNYLGAILTAFLAPPSTFRRPVLGVGHIILASWLAGYSRTIRADSQDSIKAFYAFIWKLFYAEYMLFPFI